MINPEDYEDTNRLREDLPLIKSLAEILIEEEFGILRPSTIHKTHPYELFEFKAMLGEPIIEKIKSGESIDGEIPLPKEISIRLWGEPIYKVFELMNLEVISIENGEIVVQAVSKDGLVAVVFALDFIKERIVFDPTSSMHAAKDDGSVLMAEYCLEINRFLKRYWGNGILELWDEKDGKCLGYSDAFIPVNIDLRGTIDNFNQRIKTCEEEIIKRRDSAKG